MCLESRPEAQQYLHGIEPTVVFWDQAWLAGSWVWGASEQCACIPAVVLPGLLSAAELPLQQDMAVSKLQRVCFPTAIKPSWSRLKLQD